MSVSVPCFVIRLRVLLSTVDPSFRKTRIVRVLFFFLLLLGRACESTRKERLLDVAYRKRKKKKVWSEAAAASHRFQTLYFGPR